MPHHIDAPMQDCIDRCQECKEACIETLNHCLELGGRHAEVSHIRMLLACSAICDTSAQFMLLGSPYHTRTCDACAEVCAACADACEQFADDGTMKRCADACHACEVSCREMARVSA